MKALQACLPWLALALMFAAIVYDTGRVIEEPSTTLARKAGW